VTLQGADKGDTDTVLETLRETVHNLAAVDNDADAKRALGDDTLRQAVMDKGYHSNESLLLLDAVELRAYVSEPKRGKRRWKDKAYEQQLVYGNRRRIQGEHGKALLRRRGEFVERSFAHMYETGGMRRTHLKGRENILKRLLIHAGGFNLALVMRKLLGFGKPRRLQDVYAGAYISANGCWKLLIAAKNAMQALTKTWSQPKNTGTRLFESYRAA
jgi:transposase